MTAFALQARFLLPITSPPIPGGVITIDQGRIVAVGQNTSGRPPQDLGDVALLPGLANCHTHLEFSDLAQPLGQPGMSLPAWIGCVMAQRAERTTTRDASVANGIAESLRYGTTLLGEIATPGGSLTPFVENPIDATIFLELIALAAPRIEAMLALAQQHMADPTFASQRARLTPGVSPHAPYTAHGDLVTQCAAQRITAMHLAESREELQLLANGTGPFRKLLEARGVWQEEVFCQPRRPLDYLRLLAAAPRSLVVHGNYLDDEELQFLAQRRDSMSLIYCPRTQAFFQHQRYPLPEALAAGVQVALGTDSRASNPDLSLLEEMRTVARSFPEIHAEQILRLGTIDGAKALGRDAECGSLETGKLASLIAIPIGSPASDPATAILEGTQPVQACWYRGELVRSGSQP